MYVVQSYLANQGKTINVVKPGNPEDHPGSKLFMPTDFVELLLNKGPFTIEFIKTSPTPSV